jgi:hypothetical protein
LATHAVAAGSVGGDGRRVLFGVRGFVLVFVSGAGEFVAFEVNVENFVVHRLFVGRLCQHQTERILQHGPILEAHDTDRAGGVDALGGRDFQAGPARYLQETAQRFRGGSDGGH